MSQVVPQAVIPEVSHITPHTVAQKTLDGVEIGEIAVIKEIVFTEAKWRFLDFGLVRGTKVTPLFKSPCGDPVAFFVRGAVIALRKSDCRTIIVY